MRAGEVTQPARVLAKPRDLSLLPRAHMLKEENLCELSLSSANVYAGGMAHTYTFTHRKGVGAAEERPTFTDCYDRTVLLFCYCTVVTLPVPPLQRHP